ncbi:MAG: hypothetical protein MRK01_01665 [Candidatus Scalindua sp.]|nr:hypothetical protein [Candidatus Scalindua sp.]
MTARENLARRHLNQKQKQELVRDQLRETPEISDRQISKGLGVSNNTVSLARKNLINNNQVCESHTSKGADGKTYPRQRAITTRADEVEKVTKLASKLKVT